MSWRTREFTFQFKYMISFKYVIDQDQNSSYKYYSELDVYVNLLFVYACS